MKEMSLYELSSLVAKFEKLRKEDIGDTTVIAFLQDSIIRGATLSNVHLNGVFAGKSHYVECKFVNTDLSEGVFNRCQFESCEFVDVKMINVEMANVKVHNSKFERCSFGGATIVKAEFINCDFISCDFRHGWLQDSYLESVKFKNLVGKPICNEPNREVNVEWDFAISDYKTAEYKFLTFILKIIR